MTEPLPQLPKPKFVLIPSRPDPSVGDEVAQGFSATSPCLSLSPSAEICSDLGGHPVLRESGLVEVWETLFDDAAIGPAPWHRSSVRAQAGGSDAAITEVRAVDPLHSTFHGSGDPTEVRGCKVARVALDHPDARGRTEVHGQPCGIPPDEFLHAGGQCGDGRRPRPARSGLQAGVRARTTRSRGVPSAEALRLVLTAPILADRIDEPGPLAWLEAGHDRHRHPPGSPARTRATRL